jgi:transposase-like protein
LVSQFQIDLRWVQHHSPEFQKRWDRFARTAGGSWRMGETYVRVKGEWMYLYRAVDKAVKQSISTSAGSAM